MKKHRDEDPGLKYLKEIGFNRIRARYGLSERWDKLYGRDKADKLFAQLDKIERGTTEFYDFKNSDPEISRGLSEWYDGDIIRKACNYIASHSQYFGKTILEVGCESGYMTGFLAKSFPDATIISIDRSKASIDLAKARVESLGVTNVEFRNCSLEDVTESFDTVFCMRTIQENLETKETPFIGEPILYQCQFYQADTKEYTRQLLQHVHNSRYLCVFERVGIDPLMCGWLLELCEENAAPLVDSYDVVSCEEAGDTNTFQAFVCKKGEHGDLVSCFQLWISALEFNPAGKNTLSGWNALLYLCFNAGELVRGARIMDKGCQVGRFAIFKDRDGAPTLYYFIATGELEDIKLYSYGVNTLEGLLNQLQIHIDQNIKLGFTSEDIDPNDEYLECNLKLETD